MSAPLPGGHSCGHEAMKAVSAALLDHCLLSHPHCLLPAELCQRHAFRAEALRTCVLVLHALYMLVCLCVFLVQECTTAACPQQLTFYCHCWSNHGSCTGWLRSNAMPSPCCKRCCKRLALLFVGVGAAVVICRTPRALSRQGRCELSELTHGSGPDPPVNYKRL